MGRGGRGRRRGQPNPRQAGKEGYENSPAPQEIAKERKRLDGHDQVILGLEARIRALEAFRDRPQGFASTSHTHPGGDIVSGTLPRERLPQHGHGFDEVGSGFWPNNRIDETTWASKTWVGNNAAGPGHLHPWSDLPNNGIHGNDRHDPAFQPK